MAVGTVQFKLTQESVTGNMTATLASAATVGNLLLATLYFVGTLTSVGPGWTLLVYDPSGPTCAIAIAWKYAGAAEPLSQTPFVCATTYGTMGIGEYSGVDPSTPVSPGGYTTGFTTSQALNPTLTLGPVAVQVANSYGVASCVAQATTGGTCGNAPGWSNWTSNYARFGGVWDYRSNPPLAGVSAAFTFVSGTTAQYAMGYIVILNAPLPQVVVQPTNLLLESGNVAGASGSATLNACKMTLVASGADPGDIHYSPQSEIPQYPRQGVSTPKATDAFFSQPRRSG